jgi:quercetin dioxygenase-like cupin family protein
MQSLARAAAVVFVLGAGTLAAMPQKPSSKNQAEARAMERLSRTDRFVGSVTMKNKAGKSVLMHVSVRTWGIAGGREAIRLPEQGFVIIQLHSGKLTTIIDGKEQDREEGEFWVVAPGVQMTIEVKSEEAVLQAMTLQK